MPKIPQSYDGILILPPTSEPTPINEHLELIIDPYPPELPPTFLFLFQGFNVFPHKLLFVSAAIPNCGIVVLMNGIMPELLKHLTKGDYGSYVLDLLQILKVVIID